MAPTSQDNDSVGLTLRELVLEVRTDVRDMKADLVPRVQALENDSVRTKVVASALLTEKKQRWTIKEKVIGVGISAALLILNVLTLGPDLFKF